MNELIWVESYRPKTLDQCILPERIRSEVGSLISKGSIPNLLLTGGAGIGKTTLARALGTELGYTTLVINASDEGRLLDTFRTKVSQFCTSVSLDGSKKLLVIDESDNLTHDAQSLLRNFFERHSKNCAFIMTANFPAKLMEPIRSRFAEIEFNVRADEKKQMTLAFFQRVSKMLDEEKITYDKGAVAQVVQKFFPDFRRTINELQRYSGKGTIDSGIFAGISGDLDGLIEMIKTRRWSDMRKWVAEQAGIDFAVLSKTLYSRAHEFVKVDSIPQLVILIADYQYKMAFVQDREIAVVAFLTQVMSECEGV